MPTRHGQAEAIARAIRDVFVSPNEVDVNFENANVVDGLFFIGRALWKLADAVERLAPPEAGVAPPEGEDAPARR